MLEKVLTCTFLIDNIGMYDNKVGPSYQICQFILFYRTTFNPFFLQNGYTFYFTQNILDVILGMETSKPIIIPNKAQKKKIENVIYLAIAKNVWDRFNSIDSVCKNFNPIPEC
jgi:hypothetical protein